MCGAEDVTATVEDGTGVPSVLKGDWVLFHPVYSADELHAVEVSGCVCVACGRVADADDVLGDASRCEDVRRQGRRDRRYLRQVRPSPP